MTRSCLYRELLYTHNDFHLSLDFNFSTQTMDFTLNLDSRKGSLHRQWFKSYIWFHKKVFFTDNSLIFKCRFFFDRAKVKVLQFFTRKSSNNVKKHAHKIGKLLRSMKDKVQVCESLNFSQSQAHLHHLETLHFTYT